MIDERFHEDGGNIMGKIIHEQQHIPEMYAIANEVVEKRVAEIAKQECANLINEAVNSMIGALHYDVTTALELSCKDLNEMLTSSRTRSFISDAICKEITKHLKEITLEFKM